MVKGKLLGMIRRRARLQKVRRVALWSLAGLAVYSYVGGPHGLVRYQKLKNQERELNLQYRELAGQAVALEEEIWRLENDTLYIEKVARERFGWTHKGERIFRIVDH
jgi:cell division protein FtsB